MLAGPVLIEGVERTNAVMVCLNQQAGFVLHNSYAMDIDGGNQNYYNCRGFGHLARNCRNRGTEGIIREGRRLEYKNEDQG